MLIVSVIVPVSVGGSFQKHPICDFLSLLYLDTADEMDAFSYLDAALDNLC